MRTGDEDFRDFFLAEGERLRRLGTFLTGDPDTGAEMAQETLVRVYRHWGRIRDQEPGAYARKILVNLVRTSWRRRVVERRFRESHAASESAIASPSGTGGRVAAPLRGPQNAAPYAPGNHRPSLL
jgi:DNA-directed RNA polymerase specialized sigma24 family protein